MKKIILERGEDYELSVAGEDDERADHHQVQRFLLRLTLWLLAGIVAAVIASWVALARGAEPRYDQRYEQRYEQPTRTHYKASTEPRWDLVPHVERLRIQCVPTRSALLSGNNVAGAVLELVLIKNRTREQQAALNMLRKRLTPEDRVQLQKWRLQAVNAAKQANKVVVQ